jgi:hypothetical protein
LSFLFQVAEHNLQMVLVSGLESRTLLAEVGILLVGVKLARSLLVMVGVCSGLVKAVASVHSLKSLR